MKIPMRLYAYRGGEELAAWYEAARRRAAERRKAHEEDRQYGTPAEQAPLFLEGELPTESKRLYRQRLAAAVLREPRRL